MPADDWPGSLSSSHAPTSSTSRMSRNRASSHSPRNRRRRGGRGHLLQCIERQRAAGSRERQMDGSLRHASLTLSNDRGECHVQMSRLPVSADSHRDQPAAACVLWDLRFQVGSGRKLSTLRQGERGRPANGGESQLARGGCRDRDCRLGRGLMQGTGRIQFGSPSGRTTASSRRGRVCDAGGCSTILSIYNHSPWCSVHEQPSRRTAPDRRR